MNELHNQAEQSSYSYQLEWKRTAFFGNLLGSADLKISKVPPKLGTGEQTMHEELAKRLKEKAGTFDYDGRPDIACDYEQAADAIEELTRENKELSFRSAQLEAMNDALIGETGAADALMVASKPRWIPVKEQLIHSGWYLVACNEWGGSAVRKAIYDEATRKWLEFPCGGPKDITKFVTHWMPLPEPPKEV